MVTLNKPASNTQDWYQSITDNWTTIEKSLLDKNVAAAKGDLIAATAAGKLSKFGVGTDGQVLMADSTQPSGLRWATVNSSGQVVVASVSSAVADSTTSTSFV